MEKLIRNVQEYYAYLIRKNNSNMVNRYYKKRRIALQTEINAEEITIMTYLEKIKEYIKKEEDKQIFKITFPEKETVVVLINKIAPCELLQLQKAIKYYKQDYDKLIEEINKAKAGQEEYKQKIEELEALKSSIENKLNKIEAYYKENPNKGFEDAWKSGWERGAKYSDIFSDPIGSFFKSGRR